MFVSAIFRLPEIGFAGMYAPILISPAGLHIILICRFEESLLLKL
jgi:hypothetical protein